MRKRTVRNGMRLVMAALILIILLSFYNGDLSEFFVLSHSAENRVYSLGIFWATAIGSYGVVMAAFGFVLSAKKQDESVRVMPTFLIISVLVALFFYLLSASINAPKMHEQKRVRPGETITI